MVNQGCVESLSSNDRWMADLVRSNINTRRCPRLTCLSKRNSRIKDCSGVEHIMKKLQVWLKVELREVRRDKRRQGDAENVQACSSIKRCKGMVMDLDQTGGVL
ncbi:hypothetical protein YC2023_101868 [Brassica napus]